MTHIILLLYTLLFRSLIFYVQITYDKNFQIKYNVATKWFLQLGTMGKNGIFAVVRPYNNFNIDLSSIYMSINISNYKYRYIDTNYKK